MPNYYIRCRILLLGGRLCCCCTVLFTLFEFFFFVACGQVARQRLKFSLPLIPWSSLAAMDADIVKDVRNSPNLKSSSGSLSGLLGVLRFVFALL